MLTTYLSDNPAIISLAQDKGFKKYFQDYQLPTLCNLGTAFGMGLILTTFMIGLGDGVEYIVPVLVGNVGAIIGSVFSVRIMMIHTKKYYGVTHAKLEVIPANDNLNKLREVRVGNIFERVLDATLEGGKTGVELGLAIIPGVVIICTLVMIFTFGPAETVNGVAVYTGAKKEGVALFPKIGEMLSPILTPLFGFKSAEAIAFPITALGSVGAAMGLVKDFIAKGLVGPSDIAVFTAMGMCWSGYLSTHVGMMDALGVRKLSSKAILSHTIGGIVAGISAHYLYLLTQIL
jgi:ABC-type cobalt transport system substrate-binding protein